MKKTFLNVLGGILFALAASMTFETGEATVSAGEQATGRPVASS